MDSFRISYERLERSGDFPEGPVSQALLEAIDALQQLLLSGGPVPEVVPPSVPVFEHALYREAATCLLFANGMGRHIAQRNEYLADLYGQSSEEAQW